MWSSTLINSYTVRTVFSTENSKNHSNHINETNILSESLRLHQCCEVTGYVTEKLRIPKGGPCIGGYKVQALITGAQPKAGTGLKMQTVSVVFSTLHC